MSYTPLQRLTRAAEVLEAATERAAEASRCPICHRAATANVDLAERDLIIAAQRLVKAERVQV